MFQKNGVNLHHIESRPSKQSKTDFEFYVACDNTTGGLKEAVGELKSKSKTMKILSRSTENTDDAGQSVLL